MGKLPLIMYRCIFMFLLLCTSCVEQKDTTSIKIDLMATDSDTLYYSSFVDSLSYIPLETKDDCLIREITDAILTNQYIFILDTPQQSVWIYSTKGKFIRSLHHQGNIAGWIYSSRPIITVPCCRHHIQTVSGLYILRDRYPDDEVSV